MKTTVIIGIEHPDAPSADRIVFDTIHPFIRDISGEYDECSFSVSTGVTEDALRDNALRTALAIALSDFPDEWSNDEIIDGIVDNHDDIVVWETFQYWDADDIVTFVEDTANAIYSTYF